jgi:hypothetical protein
MTLPTDEEKEESLEEERAAQLQRWHVEDLRGLLGRVLNEVKDLPPELRKAIERALAGPGRPL